MSTEYPIASSERLCAVCSTPLTNKQKLCCSAKCRSIEHSSRPFRPHHGSKRGETKRPLSCCKSCGKAYRVGPGDRGQYCSIECYRSERANSVEKVCPGCGKTFSIRKSHADSYTYCSLDCKRAQRPPELPKNPNRVASAKNPHPPVAVTCTGCNKEFLIGYARKQKAEKFFCSHACRSNHGRMTIICKYCGKEKTLQKNRVKHDKTEFCSIRCGVVYRMEHDDYPGYLANKIRSGYRTDIERFAEQVLKDLGIEYLFEQKIGRFCVDFAIPSHHIALECDGWRHDNKERQKRDKARDAYLAEKGWKVIRISDKQLREDAEKAIRQALIPKLLLLPL